MLLSRAGRWPNPRWSESAPCLMLGRRSGAVRSEGCGAPVHLGAFGGLPLIWRVSLRSARPLSCEERQRGPAGPKSPTQHPGRYHCARRGGWRPSSQRHSDERAPVFNTQHRAARMGAQAERVREMGGVLHLDLLPRPRLISCGAMFQLPQILGVWLSCTAPRGAGCDSTRRAMQVCG